MNRSLPFGPVATLLVATMAGAFIPCAGAQQTATPPPSTATDEVLERARNCTVEERDIDADCGRGAPTEGEEKAPRASAPVDLTGTWVAVVTEDWRWRMMTPPRGDYASLPLNDEGKRVADTWDPKRDVNSCKPYGAAGLMRNPLRVRVSWENDSTLRVETDHGMQTRLLHFGGLRPAGGAPSLQGESLAKWDQSGLKVVTTHLSPGYLRKNGVPYSGNTVLTEYYNRYAAFGADWLLVTTVVADPTYLSREFITSSHFKRLPDESSWHPVPCGSS